MTMEDIYFYQLSKCLGDINITLLSQYQKIESDVIEIIVRYFILSENVTIVIDF